MKYTKTILIILALTGATFFGFTRIADDPIEKIAEQLDKWLTDYPQERIHMHFDKPYYAVGDDIWFKAYVTIGNDHRLSALSGILNVDLIDERDSITQSLKLPLVSGLGWGNVALTDTLKEGNYRIRAYTKWMRNAGEDYFFEKHITIVNAVSNNVFTSTQYNYSSPKGEQAVNAVVTYTDINGQPYAAKEVSYQVQSGRRNIERGKGVTDDKGNLTLNFSTKASDIFTTGRLVTSIQVAEKEKVTKTIAIKALSDKVDVQFFPESGTLLNGIASKVAFKATGADGLGKDVKGIVKDEQGNTVATFASQHLGMGAFTLEPQAGKVYKATITYADGSQKTIDLPKAADTGYKLTVDNSSGVAFTITVTVKNPAAGVVSLVAQSGGKLLYAVKSVAGTTGFTKTLPAQRFPTGLVQLTLFTATGEPVAERLLFLQNPDQLKLDVVADKQSYAPRQKVKLDLLAKTSKDTVTEGNFSIAVIDESKIKVDEDDENTIMSDLLLTSELKGYIEKPGYYFNEVTDKTRADLDVLLLTQGYRRFEWKQILSDKFAPIAFMPERTLDVSGTVTYRGKPLPGAKITLFNMQENNQFTADTVSDKDGRFTISKLLFTDTAKLILQASKGDVKASNVTITLDNVPKQLVTTNKSSPGIQVNLNEGLLNFLQLSKNTFSEQVRFGMANRTIQLAEVVIKDKKKRPIDYSSNMNGPGHADQVFNMSEVVACSTLEQCLNGRLTGVIFRNGVPYSTRSPNMAMGVVVDGSFMTSDMLFGINPADIATVEVLRNIGYTSIYGSQGAGGVLVITTKRGGDGGPANQPSTNLVGYKVKGYTLTKAFYSPQYSDPETKASLADMRSTIYWNPSITTETEGKASVDYFNAGSKGTYRVVVEGIDINGNLGRKVLRYKVE